MTNGEWAIVVILFFGFWIVGRTLEQINEKLGKLVDITHRIRINDRERDF